MRFWNMSGSWKTSFQIKYRKVACCLRHHIKRVIVRENETKIESLICTGNSAWSRRGQPNHMLLVAASHDSFLPICKLCCLDKNVSQNQNFKKLFSNLFKPFQGLFSITDTQLKNKTPTKIYSEPNSKPICSMKSIKASFNFTCWCQFT